MLSLEPFARILLASSLGLLAMRPRQACAQIFG
jgi:hypothetical protein